MRTRAVVALLAALVLSSCGVPEVQPTQLLPERNPDGPLRKIKDTEVVERAVRALVDADTGAFRSTLLIGGGETDFVDAQGAWRFSESQGWMRMASTPNEGERTVVDYRIFRSGFYVRSTNGRDVGCWTAIGTPATPPWTPAGTVTLPSQIQALLTAKGSPIRSPRDSARGTVLLADSIGVLGPVWTQAVRAAGEAALEERVDVTFSLRGDRFTGWKVLGDDLLAALRRAKVRLSKASSTALSSYSARVVLSKPGADVQVEAPGATC